MADDRAITVEAGTRMTVNIILGDDVVSLTGASQIENAWENHRLPPRLSLSGMDFAFMIHNMRD